MIIFRMDILGKKNVPDVELSEDDLNALGGLSKTTTSGLSYNPYQKIDPKFLELNKFDEEDDDDWLYTTVSTYSFRVIIPLENPVLTFVTFRKNKNRDRDTKSYLSMLVVLLLPVDFLVY